MDWLFGSSEMSEEERIKHLDELKESNLNDCFQNDHCKMRLADYLEGLRTDYKHQANKNLQESEVKQETSEVTEDKKDPENPPSEPSDEAKEEDKPDEQNETMDQPKPIEEEKPEEAKSEE